MVYEEIGAEAFPGPPQEGLCRTLIPLRVGAEVASLNYGRHRRRVNTKRLLNAGDERHKVTNHWLGVDFLVGKARRIGALRRMLDRY